MNNYIVKSVERFSSDTLLITLKPRRGRDKIDFSPGQYAAIGYKYHGRPSPMRCFSIVSSPNNPDEVQFSMRVLGDFTNSIADLEPGNKIFLRGPFGNFIIDENYDKNVVMLAGGIGITPFMSMIRFASETRSNIPMTLLYSNQSEQNIPFYDELRLLEEKNPNFNSAFFVTNGDATQLKGARSLTGRITEERLMNLTSGNFNKFTFFVCGPISFTSTMKQILINNNTDPDRIISEDFSPSSQVEDINNGARFSINKLTYGLSAAALVLAVGFFMSLDLVRLVPKVVSADSTKSTNTSQSTSSSGSSTSASSGSSTATTSQTASAGSSTGSSTTNTTSNNQSYQAPVTSVS
ncbi:MAG TPA: FAD-dependent oxidoreductase [Candidatus Saccharimonadales bacterium]